MGLNIINDFGDHRFKSRFRINHPIIQWEFQDSKMEVLCHIRPNFVGIFSYIGLNNRPYIWNRYLLFRFLLLPSHYWASSFLIHTHAAHGRDGIIKLPFGYLT